MKRYSTLKRFSMIAVAGLLTLSACNKDKETEPEEKADSQAILVTEASASSDAVFLVNAVPEGSTKDSITATSLPASVKTYLDANYSGYTYFKTFRTNKNNTTDGYIVIIKLNGKPIGLRFDSNGNFIKVCEQRERGQLRGKGWKRGGRFDGRDGEHRDTIALSSLSFAIKTYFAASFPTDTLLAAHTEKEGGIVVISANRGLYATLFNTTGLFVKRSQIVAHHGRKIAIAQANLPAKITTYLTTTYPAFVFHRAFESRTSAGIESYVVVLTSNETKYALQFDASGNFVKSVVIK
jgi:hypothetical protein